MLVGGDDSDDIFGSEGVDRIGGGNGNDRLFGGPDRDIILGRAGTTISGATEVTMACPVESERTP